MLQTVGRIILQTISILLALAGLISLINAAMLPGRYRLSSASAIQITQVYSEATYIAVLAGAFFLGAIFIQTVLYFLFPRENTYLVDLRQKTEMIRTTLLRLESTIQNFNRN